MVSIWQLIKDGEFQKACDLADRQAPQSISLGDLHNKLLALMHLRRYADAEKLQKQIIVSERYKIALDNMFLGITLWYQGRFSEALVAWEDGLDAQYVDAAGGVETPMILLYGANQQGDDALRKRAYKLLSEHRLRPNWPAPVAQYILGKISEAKLRSQISHQPVLRMRETCQAEFYIGVSLQIEGNKSGTRLAMERACKQGPASYIEAEYYLAKWECEQAIATGGFGQQSDG